MRYGSPVLIAAKSSTFAATGPPARIAAITMKKNPINNKNMKRFNLGDTVYFMSGNQIVRGEISLVNTIERKKRDIYEDGFIPIEDKTFGIKEVKITYSVLHVATGDVSFDVKGRELFETIEELTNHLKAICK